MISLTSWFITEIVNSFSVTTFYNDLKTINKSTTSCSHKCFDPTSSGSCPIGCSNPNLKMSGLNIFYQGTNETKFCSPERYYHFTIVNLDQLLNSSTFYYLQFSLSNRRKEFVYGIFISLFECDKILPKKNSEHLIQS